MIHRTSVDVSRASQAQNVPQIGFAQSMPMTSVTVVKTRPTSRLRPKNPHARRTGGKTRADERARSREPIGGKASVTQVDDASEQHHCKASISCDGRAHVQVEDALHRALERVDWREQEDGAG